MLYIDIKVARKIRKLKTRYDENIWFDSENNLFKTVVDATKTPRVIKSGIKSQDVPECLNRLGDLGYLRIQRVWGGEYFSITSKLNHWFQFFLDSFSRKFVYGFISGMITTIVGGLVVAYVQSLLGI